MKTQVMREHAKEIFEAAVKAVQPSCLLPQHIQLHDNLLRLHGQPFSLEEVNAIYVIGAGKASAAMASEVERLLGNMVKEGIVVTKHGHALPLQKITCLEAGHPVPDEHSVDAGHQILELVQKAGKKDMIINLISGGASALLADFPPGASLGDLKELFQLLLQCGASINEMNTVRKHLSSIKGGGLSRAAYPATMVSFILSDVIGDPLHVIASGPTVPDPTTFQDAYRVLDKYKLIQQIPASINEYLKKGLAGSIPETPKEGDPAFDRTFNYLIGTNQISLEAAAGKALSLGYTPVIVTDRLTGEARIMAASLVQEIHQGKYKEGKPVCLLIGGETTVTIKGKGKGGRNQEFALAALVEVMNLYKDDSTFIPVLLSAGTDGSDGPTDATGALIDKETVRFVNNLQIDPAPYLENNDAYHFFQKAGGHIITGPTQTNVMDVVIVLLS